MNPLTELSLFGPAGFRLGEEDWDPVGARGADKVATRFVYALLTPLGSVPGRPSDGSPFVEMVRNFGSEFDVFAAFQSSLSSAVQTVRSAEVDAEPASEKFGAARLTAVAVADGQLTMTLSVTAADGATPAWPIDVTTFV